LEDRGQKAARDDDNYLYFQALSWSPNGQTLSMADSDGDMHIFDLKHGKQTGKTISTGEPMIAFAYNSEGQPMAASTAFVYSQTENMKEEQAISFWNMSRGDMLRKLPGQIGMATCMAFSPDARLLVSEDYEGNLFLWELSTAIKQQPTLTPTNRYPYLNSLTFSHNGKLLAYGVDKDVIFWEVA
jgi:WD40 repeat protein